jgi:hypothetical protein
MNNNEQVFKNIYINYCYELMKFGEENPDIEASKIKLEELKNQFIKDVDEYVELVNRKMITSEFYNYAIEKLARIYAFINWCPELLEHNSEMLLDFTKLVEQQKRKIENLPNKLIDKSAQEEAIKYKKAAEEANF